MGANLPDLDVLAYFAGPQADLEWRRGWTHGVLALTLLPFILTGALAGIHRLTSRKTQQPSFSARQLLLLSFLAILSHPVLDTMNTYGVRWLMPFRDRWFYGDTLFIIDPWVWLALSLGVYLSGREERLLGKASPGPARAALVAVMLYMAAMAASGWKARGLIAQEMASLSSEPIETVMAGPVPFDPSVKRFVVVQGNKYRVGAFRWLERPHVSSEELLTYPRDRPAHPAFEVALQTEPARRFMIWARFPTLDVQAAGPGRYLVHFVDLRYARGPDDGFGALSVPVTLR